jgi:hypothetical protein
VGVQPEARSWLAPVAVGLPAREQEPALGREQP